MPAHTTFHCGPLVGGFFSGAAGLFIAGAIIIACRRVWLRRRRACRMPLPTTRDECDDGNDDRKNDNRDQPDRYLP
jgi:hypothetical protein